MEAKPKRSLRLFIRDNGVPIMFLALCGLGVVASGKPLGFLLQETIGRMARNSFIVLSLVVPIVAGLGLNFAIVLGAMAGQAGLIAVAEAKVTGLAGIFTAIAVSFPLALLLGWGAGSIMNKAKGREMIAGMILGFFMNGVYMLVFLFGAGTILPIKDPKMILPQGYGLRNTVDLQVIKWALDNLLKVRLGPVSLPLATFAATALLTWGISKLFSTKLGQDMRAAGQDMRIAEVAGIQVDRTRMVAMLISTVLAAIGQILFLQNIGTLNVYDSHGQTGTFAIAALLVGGATVTKATVGQALLGTFMFHLLFIVSPYAGQNLLGSAMVGEYFRAFVAYAVIAFSLALHSLQRGKMAIRR
ncbi:MAG TPA: ABC transporter permease [Firmicutes bacterium]|jgi:simple sugar transport system permease protein|nr:ABC transporter permease [Candidatus Fermentithermobacillaceae bacterium]